MEDYFYGNLIDCKKKFKYFIVFISNQFDAEPFFTIPKRNIVDFVLLKGQFFALFLKVKISLWDRLLPL